MVVMKNLLLPSVLLALSCSSSPTDVAEAALPVALRCGPTYEVPIPTAKLNPADCWRISALSDSRLSEVDGDCESPVACLVTTRDSFWSVGGGDVRWTEVACSEECP